MYRVWTKSGNWDFVATEDYLKELKKTYENFYYQKIGDKVTYHV